MEEDINQMDIFSSSELPPFKFTKPIKVIELFAGYGSQMMAFEYLGKNAEYVNGLLLQSLRITTSMYVTSLITHSIKMLARWLVGWLSEVSQSITTNPQHSNNLRGSLNHGFGKSIIQSLRQRIRSISPGQREMISDLKTEKTIMCS